MDRCNIATSKLAHFFTLAFIKISTEIDRIELHLYKTWSWSTDTAITSDGAEFNSVFLAMDKEQG